MHRSEIKYLIVNLLRSSMQLLMILTNLIAGKDEIE